MDITKVLEVVENLLADSDTFVVDCTINPSNEIMLTLDSDTHVSIDRCVEISRAVDAAFDRDEEDFSLTVASAGIGEPLKLLRQYKKVVGSSVEVVLKSGVKILAKLDDATEEGVTLSYDEKVAVEGKKRKELRHTVATYSFDEIKSTVEHIDYK